ncbi:aminodeoxychorismate/anthranilate synthase component II [Bradyrhizobium sp. CB82]|uniref:anthranilate synthase component II n=1 Tax=Bradyrhizobium sp. CB82 TaxID=3039159 RepID=UPI0024B1996D|nr:aminodeoxychorismate/anthranilate synthase component II [Bradyrhizobium sp. CB82]WFU44605.1 aminodeoxychorismate/anthranilate synthase component II [Bradyrhizobium sp. CB82]
MKTLVVDAYDSFVYIIAQYLSQAGMNPTVVRNDYISIAKIERMNPDMILLGPGPGHPADAGYVDIIHHFKGRIPIMGVCLGHQAIGLAFGAEVIRAKRLMHGKDSRINHDGRGCFAGAPPDLTAVRYHSLIIDGARIGNELEVTALATDDGYVMGVRHRHYSIEGVQFHPESIGTEFGIKFFDSFRRTYCDPASIPAAAVASAR